MTTWQQFNYCIEKVEAFFGGDLQKACDWMLADNPNLGNITPVEMIYTGRGDRLIRWVDEQLPEGDAEK